LRFPLTIAVPAAAAGQRLDQFLAEQIPDVSRARVQQMLREEKALVNGAIAKSSLKLRGGEQITILGEVQPRRCEPSPRTSLSTLFTKTTTWRW